MRMYRVLKARARERAIELQHKMSTESLSYGEIAGIQFEIESLGKHYGLLKEFRENGLI